MVFWHEIDLSKIETTAATKDKVRYTLPSGPLRFQIPRGICTWGVSAYKSFQIELSNEEFINWWKNLEGILCNREPFTSNMKCQSLRIKIDESTYIFDANSKQVSPEIKEGLFREQELSCMIDIDSNYFYNENWGLTVRAYQVRYHGTIEPERVLEKGKCAFN
jgi:hypothetical protein